MTNTLHELLPLFRNGEKFVLTTHVNPDPDGLGSEIALAEWLADHGKQVQIINVSPTPMVFQFLDTNRRIRIFDPARDADLLATADVIVLLDTNAPSRLLAMEPHVLRSPAVKACIDHHLDPLPFAQHSYLDDTATSTGEMVYRILIALNGPHLTPIIAQALYAAVMTDTGSFRYPRVDPEIHRIVAHLIECGADPVTIFSMIYERWSNGRIHLLGEMLAGLRTHADGKIAFVTITREMLERTGTGEEDTDTFTSYPMSVGSVRAGILFLELADGVKISFRSKGDIPINELAKEFGGNGHKNAAGARISSMPLSTVQEQVLAAAIKYVQQYQDPV